MEEFHRQNVPCVDIIKLDKDTLYEIGLRNQYFLPASKSSFCTVDYLVKVKDGLVFCPRYPEIRLKACPTPPTKYELLE